MWIRSQPNSAGKLFEITNFDEERNECPLCKNSYEDEMLLLDKNWCCPDCGLKLNIKIEHDGSKRVIERLLVHELEARMILLRDRDCSIYELLSIQKYGQSTKLCLEGLGSIDAKTNKYYNCVLGKWH
ncbi:hypothetical protein PMSD_17200 [Paenibacillus macquariensis subsp. defensor]|nr:hypothetical protein PMSD_17200 [Paenibacillus macquariensis subsp. defensor]